MRWRVVSASVGEAGREWRGITSTVVAQWLRWEVRRAAPPARLVRDGPADAILLEWPGSVDWRPRLSAALRRLGIPPSRRRRPADAPLLVAGGAVDATPLTALGVADILCVGEGYRSVRALLACRTPAEARVWARDSPHAIEASQVDGLRRDPARPWLLRDPPPVLAEPDAVVDWDVPDVQSDDDVIRVVASKGCHLKCAFCATTYRQRYAQRPDGLAARAAAHAASGARVQLLSNDPLALRDFRTVSSRIDSTSLTSMELADRENMASLIRTRPKMVRVGLEGVSERIRVAFGKAITDDLFVEQMHRLHRGGVRFTHSFWIAGAPFERRADYAGWLTMWARLQARLPGGLHRAKTTMFMPTPPAPLMRFQPGVGALLDRRTVLAARTDAGLRRVLFITGGPSATWHARTADQFSLPARDWPAADEATRDLAPTFDHFRRFPCELIRWPLPAERRWTVSEVYRRRMTETPDDLSGSG